MLFTPSLRHSAIKEKLFYAYLFHCVAFLLFWNFMYVLSMFNQFYTYLKIMKKPVLSTINCTVEIL